MFFSLLAILSMIINTNKLKSNLFHLRTFILIAYLISLCNFSIAQEYSYRNYNVPEGLAQSEAFGITEDKNGFLWVCTKGGASHFDGIEFKNITKKDGLVGSFVTQIIDNKERKTCLMQRFGISVFDGRVLKSYNCPKKTFATILVYFDQQNNIAGFAIDTSNQIFSFKIYNDQLIAFTDSTSDLNKYVFTLSTKHNGMGFNKIYQNPYTLDIVITTLNEILFFRNDGIFLKRIPLSGIINLSFAKNKSIVLADNVFYIFKDHEIVRSINSPVNIKNKEHTETSVVAADGDKFFFTDLKNYLWYYDGGSFSKDNYRFNSWITSLHFSSSKSLWILTDGQGIFKLLSTAFINYIPGKCEIIPNIWSIGEDKNGKMLFASQNAGLQTMGNNNFKKIDGNPWNKKLNYFYMGSYTSPEKINYLTNTEYIVLKYDGQRLSRFFKSKETGVAFMIRPDKVRNKLIIATSGGLLISDYEGKSTFYPLKIAGNQNCVSVSIDKNNRYWLASFNGMIIWDNGKITELPTKDYPVNTGAISHQWDSYGNLWVGTDNGLYILKDGKYSRVFKESFPSLVSDIHFVGQDTIIVGALNGIAIINLPNYYRNKSGGFRFFNQHSGFAGIECGQNSMYSDSSGNTWIATSDRVVRIIKKELPGESQKSKPIITNILAARENGQDSVLNLDSSLYLPHYLNSISFTIRNSGTQNPEKVKYQIFLEGFDESWHDAGLEMPKYRQLKPGKYTFHVKTIEDENGNMPSQIYCKFEIMPIYWQTKWFIALILVFFLVILIVTIRAIVKKKHKMQIQKLSQKQMILELQLKTILGQLNPHFVFNAMNSIGSMIYSTNIEAYNVLQKFSKLIRFGIDSSDSIFHFVEEEIDFITNYLLIEKIRFEDKLEYNINIQKSENKILIPKMLLQNFVENSVKYGIRPGDIPLRINVSVFNINNNCILIVSDNGMGIKNDKECSKKCSGKGIDMLMNIIKLENEKNTEKVMLDFSDIKDDVGTTTGCKVQITIPLNYKF